ncbi:MAG TPA: peptide-methionine (R)-S-oxide reductase MsrB [Candidatus Saccharimonadales bacterium]|nr:peptide-methionine (R)-S-oxide reductase MsrB [Candidatus Saccharimonadales bacterium]
MADAKANPGLTDQQKDILFNKGTEAPFTGKFLHNKDSGMYTCANCGAELFSSDTKFDSHTPGLAGWPSFSEVAKSGAVKLVPDNAHGMSRTEVVCANCGGHLGHFFSDDQESPNGQHFCINGCVLDFKPSDTSHPKSPSDSK